MTESAEETNQIVPCKMAQELVGIDVYRAREATSPASTTSAPDIDDEWHGAISLRGHVETSVGLGASGKPRKRIHKFAAAGCRS